MKRLSQKKKLDICELITEAWQVKPAVRAAEVLKDCGYTSQDLWLFQKTRAARLMPEEWCNNTLNELRDMERLKR